MERTGRNEDRLWIDTPVGLLTLCGTDRALTFLRFGRFGEAEHSNGLLLEAAGQLREYFEGVRRDFTVPLAPEGTPFQQSVWRALLRIPYGETATYRQIAEAVGHPKSFRAVGQANHRNPIPILIPCHRVIGSNGELTGYAGGNDVKQFLLNLENG